MRKKGHISLMGEKQSCRNDFPSSVVGHRLLAKALNGEYDLARV
jgi:hypothetical protein